MSNRRIRAGDEVLVIAGNDKGRIGKIISFKEERVIVEGINIRKKHMRKTQENQKGQIIDIECSIHISNVSPCVNGKAVKLRARINDKKKKELYYLEEGKKLPYRPAKKAKS